MTFMSMCPGLKGKLRVKSASAQGYGGQGVRSKTFFDCGGIGALNYWRCFDEAKPSTEKEEIKSIMFEDCGGIGESAFAQGYGGQVQSLARATADREEIKSITFFD